MLNSIEFRLIYVNREKDGSSKRCLKYFWTFIYLTTTKIVLRHKNEMMFWAVNTNFSKGIPNSHSDNSILSKNILLWINKCLSNDHRECVYLLVLMCVCVCLCGLYDGICTAVTYTKIRWWSESLAVTQSTKTKSQEIEKFFPIVCVLFFLV